MPCGLVTLWSPRHSTQVIPSNLLHRPQGNYHHPSTPHLIPSSSHLTLPLDKVLSAGWCRKGQHLKATCPAAVGLLLPGWVGCRGDQHNSPLWGRKASPLPQITPYVVKCPLEQDPGNGFLAEISTVMMSVYPEQQPSSFQITKMAQSTLLPFCSWLSITATTTA